MKTGQRNRKQQQGTVLPAIFTVLAVLMFLVLALTSLSTTSLRQAAYYSQDDQALFASDAGLARALAEYQATGDLGGESSAGTIDSTGATYQVQLYANDGPGMLSVPGGGSIPPGTALLVSEGRAEAKRSVRRSTVLVQKGLGTVQVGSLANSIDAQNSQFFAFDSNRESAGYVGLGVDPASILGLEAIIATNESTGTPVTLQDSQVNGDILVGPGGDPNAQVDSQGDSTTGRIGVLTEEIDIPPIEVPTLPGDDETGEPPSPQSYKPTSSPDHVSVTQDANGKITIVNQCFVCTISPDGSFHASEAGYGGSSAKEVSGNLKTGEVIHHNTSTFVVNTVDDALEIGGAWHGFRLDANGTFTVDAASNDSGATWIAGSRQTFSAPAWFPDRLFKTMPPDLENPDALDSGYYGDIVIDAGKTVLENSSTMIVKSLKISDGGQLNLPQDGRDISIYVTEELEISGLNAILNESRKAPELRIFYLGTKPVTVSGGASAFLTLMAPEAEITLKGEGSTFFGALVAKSLKLLDAEFYYDVATDGVGTGTDGTTLTVLAHQRF